MTNAITLTDVTLRDGNHAVRHSLTLTQIADYAQAADYAGIDIIEVGHGNGLGASSCQLGIAPNTDWQMLLAARKRLKSSRLGIHFIPGLGKAADIDSAIAAGVDVFRIASHCTEANVCGQYIKQVKAAGKTGFGVLMMSHMANSTELLYQSRLLENYGAEAIVLMDSAGHSIPSVVEEKVGALVAGLNIPVGYHAHNNLGLAVANSLAAVESGAQLLDASIGGFGAGAGNTQLELLVAVLERYGYQTNTDFSRTTLLAESSECLLTIKTPHIAAINIATGAYGLFSGFAPHIQRLAAALDINPLTLCERLGQRKLVAGQEDIILEEAHLLARQAHTPGTGTR